MGSDDGTSEYTLGSGKKSIPDLIKGNSMSIGGVTTRVEILEKLQVENNSRLNRHDLFFKIIWICVGIVGTILGILFSWILSLL